MDERLTGRIALVTGASSGIGEATARLLAEEGAALVLTARREERLEELAAEIEEAGGRALVAPADITDRRAVESVAERALEALGRVDILVNNAGIMPLAPLRKVRVAEWDRMVDVNVKGVLYAIGAVLPAMLERGGGHVVNVSSLASRRPFPGGAVYSATKFAVRSLSQGLRLELSPTDGIRVTDIEPGLVATELPESIGDDETREEFYSRLKGTRMLEPVDVARAIRHAVTQPERVNVNEVLVRPTDQAT